MLDPVESKSAAPGGGGEPIRVLAVEDAPMNLFLIKAYLKGPRYTLETASNGAIAVEKFQAGEFDIVLMDVQMPVMDGLEATAALRAKEIERGDGSHQPVIALTAHAMKGDQERCLAAGMDGYLAKPIRPQELDAILETYLTRRMPATPEIAEVTK